MVHTIPVVIPLACFRMPVTGFVRFLRRAWTKKALVEAELCNLWVVEIE